MCAKDFNEIFRQEEKLEGAFCNHHQMQLFRDVIYECCFMDLGSMDHNLLGANILKMVILFGNDLIRGSLILIGF